MRESILDVGAPIYEFCMDLVASVAVMNTMTRSSSLVRKGFRYAYTSMSQPITEIKAGT